MNAVIFLEKTLSVIFWVLVIFGFDTVDIAVLTLVSALIHESGHIAVLAICKKKTSKIPYGQISGLRISVSEISYKEEIAIALGGPIINLAAAALAFTFPFPSVFGDYIKIFGFLNLMTMASNLLPICGYDGYKAIEACVMLKVKDPSGAKRILSNTSFIFCILMCFTALYFMLKLGEGYWIFAIFLSTIIREIRNNIS